MSKLHILVVDDTPSNLAITEAYLEPFIDALTLTLAESGTIAIKMAQTQHFDLIFMDLEMPEIDGFETAKQIRALCNSPIIAMTGHTPEHIKQHPLSHNFNGFIGKPFDDKSLLTLINQHCLIDLACPTANYIIEKAPKTPNNNTIALLDINGVCQRLNNNTKLIARILKSFSENNTATYGHFAHALENEQWDVAKRIAHTLKGGGANIGANYLSEIGAKLEKICLTHTPPNQQQMSELKEALEKTIEQAQQEHEKLVANLNNKDIIEPKIQAKEINDELKIVLTYLQSDVGAAQDKLDEIEAQVPNNPEIQQMIALFNQFDLDGLAQKIEDYLSSH